MSHPEPIGPKSTMRVLFVCLCYFVVLATYAIYAHHPSGQIDAFATTARDLLKFSPSDPGSFMTGSMNIAEKGWISPENNWIISFWPPGFLLVEAGLIKLIGPDTPYFVFVIQLLACAVWAVVLTKLSTLLRTLVTAPLAWALPLLLWIPSMARSFLLEPGRVIYGETFSIAFFFLGVLCALQACTAAKPRKLAIAAGISIGVAAYFRSQFELFVLGLTFWLLVAWVWSLIRAKRQRISRPWMGIALTVVLAAHVVMAPWRIYHQVTMGSPKWVYTETLSFSTSVMSREELLSKGGEFIVEGGGGLTCRIDPTTCGRIAEAPKLFLRTLLTHPLEWHAIKFGIIGKYFFASQQDIFRVKAPATAWDTTTNVFFLLAILVALLSGLLLARRQSLYAPIINWTNIAIVSAHYLIFMVHQYEIRYFYFGKLYASLIALLGLVLLFTQQKQKTT